MGKTGRKNRVYSAEFKTGVIMDMRENYLSHRETVRKYWNTQNRTEDRYLHTLRNWERIYLEEDLIAENQRLRMEIVDHSQ